jgi:Tol biopolymer transport system component
MLPIIILSVLLTGCGGSSPVTRIATPQTLAIASTAAFDGSDSGAGASNTWLVKSDGTGAVPLTRMSSGSSEFGAVWSPDGTKIAVASSRALDGTNGVNLGPGQVFNIWVINADGSGATPLTKMTVSQGLGSFDQVWSPDSKRIAFVSDRALDGSNTINTNATFNIWVINADGSGLTATTKMTQAGSVAPAWSPDGSKLAFASGRALDGSDAAGPSNVWIANPDGSGAAPLSTLTAAYSIAPAWSPDGSKIAFLSSRALDGSDATTAGQGANIWVMNSNGSAAAPLTTYTTAIQLTGGPIWSADGKRIAFHSDCALDGSDAANTNSTLNVWVVNADGSALTPVTRLTFAGLGALNAAWSSDGTSLAFSSDRALDGSDALNQNHTLNVWSASANGSGAMPLTRYTSLGASGNWPAWKQ